LPIAPVFPNFKSIAPQLVLEQTVFAPLVTVKQQQTTLEEQMKFNQWTLGLAAVGAVSLASAVRADEAKMSMVNTALSNTTISGYVDVAAQWNLGDQPNSGATTYYSPAGKTDGFSLNDVDVTIAKPQDESPWAAGYTVELNAGSGAINGASTSLTYTRNGNPVNWMTATTSGVGVRQAYVALRTPVGNGIDWKIGVMDGITGYEGNTGYSNPNYTRSYGYDVNPASQVGLLGTYKVCNAVSVTAGMVNRGNTFASFDGTGYPGQQAVGLSSKDYVGSVSLTAPDSWGFLKGSSLNLQTVQGFDNGAVNNYSVNGTLNTPVAGLKVGFAYDAVQSLTQNGAQDLSWDANIYGVYATYQATDKLALNLRGEYVDLSGTVQGAPNIQEVTATLEYDLWANVVSRVEARWDHVEHGTLFATENAATENSFLLALNVVYKF
jgi:Putative beta-barrel porin-2, OmpL-like. bbp2